VTDAVDDLQRRFNALGERFARVSAQLAEAGQSMIERGVLPAEAVFDEVTAARTDFEDLGQRLGAVAESLSVPAGNRARLADLDAALAAIVAEQGKRSARAAQEAQRRAATEEARHKAEEQARRLAAEDEAKRRAQEEARRKADDEARRKAAEEESKRKAAAEEAKRKAAEEEARRKAADEEAKRKAAEEAKRKATEEEARRKAAEEEAKRKAAAEEAKRKAAEEEARRKAAEEEAKRKAAAEEAKRKAAEEEARRKAAEEEAKRKAAEEEARRKAAEEAKRKVAEEEAKRKAAEEAARKAAEEAARKAAEEAKRKVAEEEARRKAAQPAAPAAAGEEPGEELALETAQWWISASASWGNLRSRRVAFPDAVRDVLAKYPYLFSIPIQTSADYEDGLLAYGFAVVLEHVEQRAPGFVADALNRLPARKGASLGRRLYEYLAERLRPAYAEFVKAVMLAALPKPGLWVNGGIEDSDAATTVFQRGSARIGDPNQKGERFTNDRQRFGDHQFTVAVAPLTSRFFRVEAADVKEPRDLEVRLSEKGVPSDQAWLVPLQGREASPQARRHERQGVVVNGLGREVPAVWIALFNADAETEKRFELVLGLRPKGRAAATPFRRPR
jgi:hypothetical protein